jgi:hypothetical protein
MVAQGPVGREGDRALDSPGANRNRTAAAPSLRYGAACFARDNESGGTWVTASRR